MIPVKNIFLILLFISTLFNPVFSQEISQGEAELEMKAFDLFLKKDFIQAKPLFSQLLSLYPKEPDYNYGYGVCLIETNDDIEKAIKYLSFASTKSDNPVIYFYLGRAYHLSYKFDDALANYGSYKSKATPADLNEYNANMYIEMAKNGKNLIRYISDLIVIDNKKIKQNNFHYSYELDDFGGKLIAKPVEFQSKVDQKLGHSGLMFLSDSGYVYFSSYGSNKKGSKDIFRAKKLPDGSWGASELLGPEINTSYDEDYPFIHPDNKTLYFSSKGHNTMGGYDVFRSVCDSTGTHWSQPQNMDFPTNSPFDDILYISDAKEDYAYFASNRETSGEQISVFKIEVDKNPIEKEIKTYEEVIQKSRLEITPLALRSNKDQNNLANNPTNKDNNSKDSDYYKFDQLNYSSNLTINDLLAQAQKDKKIVEEEISNSQKEADLAYILSDEKNKEADQKKIEAEKLKSSNPDEAENLLNEAENLDQEAISAFNIAKVLENNAIEKSKDAEKLIAMEEKISVNENQDINALYNELVTNREELNKSSEKYSDYENEIQNREKLVSENEKDKDSFNNQLTKIENENKDIVNQLSELDTRLKATKDPNEKSLISEDITTLKKDIEENNQTEVKIKQDLAKIEIENNKIKNEISIINVQKEFIKNNLTETENSNFDISSVNKEDLKKEIFSKELIADKNNADEIIKAQNNIKIPENIVTDVNVIKSDTSSENTVIKEYVKPVIQTPDYTSEKANSIINSAVKDKIIADSLNFIAEQKQKIYHSTTDPVIKQKLENEINELNDLASIKEQQFEKKLNEAEIAEGQYLAENEVKKDSLIVDNNNPENNTEVKNLYSEGINNKNISDSLFYIADLKRNELKNTSDPVKIESLNKEINDLEELARMKKEKADQQLKDQGSNENVIADNYISYQEDMIDNNPVFSFGDSESADSKVKQYEKELFNAKYYSNLSQSQEKKLEAMKNMQNNIEDPNLKNTLQKDISQLEKLITYSKKAAEESNDLAKSLKIQATNESNQADASSEYLLVKATEYKAKNDFDLTKVEKETLGFTRDDRAFADGSLTNWFELKKEIETLKTELNGITDEKEKKKVEEKIELKENEQKSNFENLNSIYQESNSQEYLVYKGKLEKLRFAVSDENIVLANNLEKEADIIFDQSKIIRENSGLIENPEDKNTELIKAKNLELVAIQKQKHAIDIFIENADKKDQLIAAENTTITSENKDSASADISNDNKNITLLPEEEKQLNMYRKEAHIAETLEADAKKSLDEIRIKRDLADKTFNPSEKSKLLKEVEKKEPAAKNKLADAYTAYGKSDSLKYDLYKNQISGLQESLSDVGYNKQIAKQFVNEADFYYDQAIALRQQADKEEDINNKLGYLQKAVEFEKKAIESQEIAVDVLMNVDPVEFASSNTLTKVDRLDVLNQPVNTEKIQEIQTKSIIEKTEFPEKDLKALDATKNLEVTKAGLENDIVEIEKIINEQENIISISDDAKEKKKAEKIIDKQNKMLLATRFANADLSAQINDSKYWIYKENAVNYRTKGNSDDARIGRQLEKDANADYNKAKSLRDKSFFVADPGDSYKMLVEADSLEKSAISDMEKAYSVYLNIEIIDTVFLADNNKENEFNNLIVKNNADISPIDSSDIESGNNLKTDSVIVENLNDTVIKNDTTDINTDITEVNNDLTEVKTDSLENSIIENVDINPVDTNSRDITENIVVENITKTDSVQNNAINNNIVKNSNPVISEILNYSIQPVSKYSAVNPIPMNESLPEGIVFKVQIGAFKSAIKQDSFGGLNPVTGETSPGSAYTRYLVGLFKTYEGATLVKNEVNTMGYRDAFIVAYKDGKRIPLYQARNMIQESGASEKELYNAIAQTEVNAIKNRTASSASTANANTNPNTNTNKTTNPELNTETSNQTTVTGIDIKKVNGLLYTVQIGVYKQPITHDKLLNLTPIYEEKTEYGFIRYTTGVFDNQNLAEAEKSRIVKLGISDAFVTAYYNGKRLSIGDAKNIENSNNKDIFANTDPVKMAEQPVTNPTENLGDVSNPDIVFKVQIGAYKEQVPTSVVSDFIRVASNQGLDQVRDATGITIYTVGNYKNYDQATQMKTVLMNEGIKDAFVVSYNGKQKIPVNEAIRLLGL